MDNADRGNKPDQAGDDPRQAGASRLGRVAAIGYSPKPGAEYTEADWTDPDMPGLAAYPRGARTMA